MRNVKLYASDDTVAEQVIFPLNICEYRDYEEIYRLSEHRGYTRNRSFAPYQPGEVFFYKDGIGDIGVARVLRVHPHYLRSHYHYIPMYHVQTITKKGNWSKNWKVVYPGSIFRAYCEIDRPTVLNNISEI
jgi:hypothetical protein